jgi:CRISPR-associated protein (TIGR03986 family)
VGSWTEAHRRASDVMVAWGYVCATNQSIGRKHDERIFFVPRGGNPFPETLNVELKERWRALVENYQAQHRDEVKKRHKRAKELNRPEEAAPWVYLGRDPGDTAWSRHIYEDGAERLEPQTLCYAKVDQHGGIRGLYPVMISRELYAAAPIELLSEALRPANKGSGSLHSERFARLSPADRVFGWVSQSGDGAWRGQLRVGPIRCEDPKKEAIQTFNDDDGLPLAILSTPKPQQARFYVAKNKNGDAQDGQLTKADATYVPGKGLRGRKFYPHQRAMHGSPDYWNIDGAVRDTKLDIQSGTDEERQDRLANGAFREYVRRRGHAMIERRAGRLERKELSSRDDQNRSIRAWVKDNVVFKTFIDVINLNEAELGALLWLLSLNQDAALANGPFFLRLGGGKPLGFGSVRVTVAALDLADGEGKKIEYASLLPLSHALPEVHFVRAKNEACTAVATRFVNAYRAALCDAYANRGGALGFEHIGFIAAFLVGARGFEDERPIHYPRTSRAPDPAGESYKWFVTNEQTGDKAPVGNRLALDALAGDRGLPYWGS